MDTLSQHVTDTLRDWVLHGKFSPGARLEEIPLAEKLGVSRTPVRAALATLGNEGLLEHPPKRGYTVRAYDIGEIVAATRCGPRWKGWLVARRPCAACRTTRSRPCAIAWTKATASWARACC